MKIAIIGAMEEEILFLKDKIKDCKCEEINSYHFFTGSLFNNEIILVQSGIGKVASGLLVATLVDHYAGIELIINVGVSGGIRGNTNTGDIVIGEKMAYLDVSLECFGYKYGQMADCPETFFSDSEILKVARDLSIKSKVGMILTADSFLLDYEYVVKIWKKYFDKEKLMAVDMETTALAQCAYKYKIKYLVVRAISDVVGETSQVDGYENSLDFACKRSNEFIYELLKNKELN